MYPTRTIPKENTNVGISSSDMTASESSSLGMSLSSSFPSFIFCTCCRYAATIRTKSNEPWSKMAGEIIRPIPTPRCPSRSLLQTPILWMAAHRGCTGKIDLAIRVCISTPSDWLGVYPNTYKRFSQHAKPRATEHIATVMPDPVDRKLFVLGVFSPFPLLASFERFCGSKSGVTTIQYPKYLIISSHRAAMTKAFKNREKMNNAGCPTAKSFIACFGSVCSLSKSSLSSTRMKIIATILMRPVIIDTTNSNIIAIGVVSRKPHAKNLITLSNEISNLFHRHQIRYSRKNAWHRVKSKTIMFANVKFLSMSDNAKRTRIANTAARFFSNLTDSFEIALACCTKLRV
mmetsp:Transcript_30282/g.39071  ORF Transcript_30282/g.39071 Transcript_30282/m.39071 type:complete len:346 (+) Transcript_30282:128-1165(+)